MKAGKLPDDLVRAKKAEFDAASPAQQAAWAKLEGFIDDEKVPIRARYWEGIRRTLALMLENAVAVVHETDEMLDRVKHSDGCPGIGNVTEQCAWTCPDREWRLSALTIRHSLVRFIGMYDLPTPNSEGVILPVPREFLDQMISELDLLRQRDEWRRDVYDNHPLPPLELNGAPELEQREDPEPEPKGEPYR